MQPGAAGEVVGSPLAVAVGVEAEEVEEDEMSERLVDDSVDVVRVEVGPEGQSASWRSADPGVGSQTPLVGLLRASNASAQPAAPLAASAHEAALDLEAVGEPEVVVVAVVDPEGVLA